MGPAKQLKMRPRVKKIAEILFLKRNLQLHITPLKIEQRRKASSWNNTWIQVAIILQRLSGGKSRRQAANFDRAWFEPVSVKPDEVSFLTRRLVFLNTVMSSLAFIMLTDMKINTKILRITSNMSIVTLKWHNATFVSTRSCMYKIIRLSLYRVQFLVILGCAMFSK